MDLELKSLGAVVAAGLLAALFVPAPTFAARELVRNPLLSEGADGQPKFWKTAAYDTKPQSTRFSWKVNPDQIGMLEIESTAPNDARFVQTVTVSPDTWYNVTGWGKARGIGKKNMGLSLGIMGTFHNSRDLRGTTGWQPLSFWVKTDNLTSLEIACRLGGYSSLNTGKGWCTGISVLAAGTPDGDSRFIYGSVEETGGGAGPGVQALALLVVVGIVLLLWRYLRPPQKPSTT